MYIHIGKDIVLNTNNIIGIFNIELLNDTDEYKKIYEDMMGKNKVIDISDNSKKSFILFIENKQIKAYISNINAVTIAKRKDLLNN